jgi:hypothetical protein
MDAKKFLQEKGILNEDKKEWKVIFEDGREFSIVNLMEEYSILKSHEIMIMKNK